MRFSAVCYQNELICHFCYDWCVHPMRLMSTCVLNYAMSSVQRCLPCIFVINVVTSTSMQTRLRVNAVFSPCSAVILMPCKHVATNHSMHNLEMFCKYVLIYMPSSNHTCPWLHLWPAIAYCNLALKLLNNVAVSLLTLCSVLPCVLLVIHAPHDLALAILSFTNMPSYCW